MPNKTRRTTSARSSPAIEIRSIKVHRRVALDEFDAWVAVFRDEGKLLPLSVDDYATVNLRICDFGHFDLIACGPEFAEAWGPTDVTIHLSGLQTLAQSVRERGECILAGPEPCEFGWRLVVRHRDAHVIEYLERA